MKLSDNIIAAIITGIFTLVAGICALWAGSYVLDSGREQIKAIQQNQEQKRLEDQLSTLRAFLADITAIIQACKEYPSSVDQAAANPYDGLQILPPFSSQFYKELFKSNGLLKPEIAGKISVFYNALPNYEQVLKRPLTIVQLNNPNTATQLKKNSIELQGRAEELQNIVKQEIIVVQKQLEQPNDK